MSYWCSRVVNYEVIGHSYVQSYYGHPLGSRVERGIDFGRELAQTNIVVTTFSRVFFVTLCGLTPIGAHHGLMGEINASSRPLVGADEISVWTQIPHRSSSLPGQLD